MDVEKIIQQHQELMAQVAETQVSRLVGEAVLRLVAQGQTLTVDALVQAMRQPVAHLTEKDFGRTVVEGAIAALQDAAKPA